MRKHEYLCVRSQTAGLTSIVDSEISTEVEVNPNHIQFSCEQ